MENNLVTRGANLQTRHGFQRQRAHLFRGMHQSLLSSHVVLHPACAQSGQARGNREEACRSGACPRSARFSQHNIVKQPVVFDGKVEIKDDPFSKLVPPEVQEAANNFAIKVTEAVAQAGFNRLCMHPMI